MDRSAPDLSKASPSPPPVLPPSSSISSAEAANIPWMMLERFVFVRNDDDGSFPDDAAAPMRANSSTSFGDRFTIALLLAAPPGVSRLYVQWQRGPREPVDPDSRETLLLTSDRRLFLLSTTSRSKLERTRPIQQDFFVFRASFSAGRSALTRLPSCTEPILLPLHGKEIAVYRWFHHNTIGIVRGRGSDIDKFAVVQLAKFVDFPGHRKMGAELCVFRSGFPSSKSKDEVAEGNWEVLKLPIHHSDEEFSDLEGWSTDGTITFKNSICWVDYHHGGILLYTPALAAGGTEDIISYIRLPIDNRPRNSLPSQYPLERYRSLCVTGPRNNEQLKFIDVARKDDAFFGMIRDGSSFTITCHTFTTTYGHKWHKDADITSKELWHPKSRKSLIPRNAVTTFPLVSWDEPHLIHFIMSELTNKIDMVLLVVVDIIKKKAVSVSTYIEGEEDLCGKHADMVSHRSRLPRSFLPCQF
ncbi:uncharacterized protein [Lolium perenne]|uniref:uncharacterized protein n=1 Tax=Lolium perenne TaxID=4522 RepID=UPI0021EB157A|nr:uncharacterized protein LOC127342321 [Lolium perenne]